MLVNDGQSTTTVIPIQGTFDIAQGRNAIRTKITLRRWPLSFNARASTAMTALGEMILLSDDSRVTPVQITFIEGKGQEGIELRCRLQSAVSEASRWEAKVDNLSRVADDLAIEDQSDQISVSANVWL